MEQRHFPLFPMLVGLAMVACAGVGVVRYSNLLEKVAQEETGQPITKATTPAKPSGPTLEKEQREFIWQVEHEGNLLRKFGFKPLANALSKGDGKAITDLLAADFTGLTLQQPRQVHVDTPFAKVIRYQSSGQPPQSIDRAAFVSQLLDYRRPFRDDKPPKVEMALMMLSPQVREQLDGPWQGTVLLRMYGEMKPIPVTSAGSPKPSPGAGIGEVMLHLHYQTPRPTEDNLSKGGWLRSCTINQSQEARAPHFLLHDVTRERGLNPDDFHDNWIARSQKGNTGGVYLCDFDRDGILDMLVTDINRYTLYQGQADGTFKDVTVEVGLPTISLEVTSVGILGAWVDLDGDGWEDLILGDHVYRNEPGEKPGERRFVDYTKKTNLRLPRDAGAVVVADYDRDGLMDLYVTRPGKGEKDAWIDGKSGDPQGNQLWRNKGNWQFEDVTAATGTDGDHRSTFTAVWLDINNDGWPDLYVLNEFGNGVLYVNDGKGKFHAHQLAAGPNDFGSMGATAGDIDNDGHIDLYIGNMYSKAGKRVIGNLKPGTYSDPVMAKMQQFVAGSQMWRNRGGLQFDKLGEQCQVAAVGWAYGAALVDLDNDGWLDLYASCGFMSQKRSEPDG